jgi:molybdopterin biosynthesis enzyme
MVSVEQALEIVLRETPTLSAEEVALDEALARVLAEDVRADRDLPPFDRAAMDGYALRAADVAQAPCALELVG